MASKRQVSKRLSELGMAWAIRSDKFTAPSDPYGAQARGERTYHIHPDYTRPEVTAIKRFRTLREILDYCDATEMANSLSRDGEYDAAESVVADFWASIA